MEYVVQPFSGNNYYTDSRKDAEEIYAKATQSYEFVQLLAGESGHYETVRQSW